MEPENWRPWGYFEILTDGPCYKVKRIVVQPKKRLSLQFHLKRYEHWVIVSGQGKITIGQETMQVGANTHIYIPLGMQHRIENVGDEPLVFIETQCGDDLSEEDIVRLEDDFGRDKQ